MILRAGAQAGLADGAQPVQRLADQLGVAGDAVGGVQLLQLGAQGAPVGAKALPLRARQHIRRAEVAIRQLRQGVHVLVGLLALGVQTRPHRAVAVQPHAGQTAMALQMHHQVLQGAAPLHAILLTALAPALAKQTATHGGGGAQQGHAGNRQEFEGFHGESP